ncbi:MULTISPECIES: SMC-Scp complex subunit ScpB [Rossellomorea]|uniref:Segregation and condensation protein B n=1 Tax=Rossellomorea aquimaris TaxID=189382 RepID=A0A5D4UH74_9BACI|nr:MULTISPECIES: SMC-Scp complex subunit ScpB [Rossellomorea]MDT9024722.1 SMC-Scp complex subunit ScpB [Rossellomorea sp. YC4-1]TYS77461.1 SMC-Scp complex subunit ScpB [Rossellomorea aquimaris]TYS86642.1 SMC-Scp complex subunit ScpB [Rossellomorea aquimaris]TYS87425.1 SMC-Scp complex subunit ScpB [Rossellomorea aquimaris]
MNSSNWKGILESLLFAAGDEGLSLKQVCSVLEIGDQEAMAVIEELKADYENDPDRGIYMIEIADTFQLVTKKSNADYLKKLVESPNVSFLSQAALETLAIVAYKQPITRMEIEQIRGVKTERPIQTLTSKGLVKEVGRAEGTGRAYLFGTTKEFLDYFGLKRIEELPPLPENIEDEFMQDEADLFFEKFQETMESKE